MHGQGHKKGLIPRKNVFVHLLQPILVRQYIITRWNFVCIIWLKTLAECLWVWHLAPFHLGWKLDVLIVWCLQCGQVWKYYLWTGTYGMASWKQDVWTGIYGSWKQDVWTGIYGMASWKQAVLIERCLQHGQLEVGCVDRYLWYDRLEIGCVNCWYLQHSQLKVRCVVGCLWHGRLEVRCVWCQVFIAQSVGARICCQVFIAWPGGSRVSTSMAFHSERWKVQEHILGPRVRESIWTLTTSETRSFKLMITLMESYLFILGFSLLFLLQSIFTVTCVRVKLQHKVLLSGFECELSEHLFFWFVCCCLLRLLSPG